MKRGVIAEGAVGGAGQACGGSRHRENAGKGNLLNQGGSNLQSTLTHSCCYQHCHDTMHVREVRGLATIIHKSQHEVLGSN